MASQTILSRKLGTADNARDQLSDVEAHFLQVLLEVSQVSVAFDRVESCSSERTVSTIEVAVLLSLLGVDLRLMLDKVEGGVRAETAEAAIELLCNCQVLGDASLVVAGDHVFRQLGCFSELVLAELAVHPAPFGGVLVLDVLLQPCF